MRLTCQSCGTPFESKRRHTKTCSTRCRVRLHRNSQSVSREKFRVLDLFAGIGGFSLGLEATGGFETVAFCEIEEFPRKVLNKHWPDTRIYEDVRQLSAGQLARDGIRPSVITGGFPCQDISVAGKGAGIEGERSGLWSEYHRLIGELRPRYAIMENTPALLGRGLGRVLGDLAEVGYDAEWHCIPAAAVGARHRRDRVWIIAYPNEVSHKGRDQQRGVSQAPAGPLHECRLVLRPEGRPQWPYPPGDSRAPDGLPDWSHRIGALGNAVVPQIPQMIGQAILEAEGMAHFWHTPTQKDAQADTI